MIVDIARFFRLIIIIALLFLSASTSAQTQIIQRAIDKLEHHQNFSYLLINKRKDFSADTSIQYKKELFLRTAADSIFGYLFKLETVYKTETFCRTDIYNGETLVSIFPEDDTYEVQLVKPSVMFGTLLHDLNWIRGFVERKAHSIVRAGDTTINGIIIFTC